MHISFLFLLLFDHIQIADIVCCQEMSIFTEREFFFSKISFTYNINDYLEKKRKKIVFFIKISILSYFSFISYLFSIGLYLNKMIFRLDFVFVLCVNWTNPKEMCLPICVDVDAFTWILFLVCIENHLEFQSLCEVIVRLFFLNFVGHGLLKIKWFVELMLLGKLSYSINDFIEMLLGGNEIV